MTPTPGESPSSSAPPEIAIIVAMARNRVIGDGSGMPWHLPEDLAHFKRTTIGGVLVMGRRTFDSIGRPLPGRHTVVVTRDPHWHHTGVHTAAGLDEAMATAAALVTEGATIWVAGGGEIYRLALPHVTRLVVTEVDLADDPAGSVTFPEIDPQVWQETEREARPGLAFVTYRRRDQAS